MKLPRSGADFPTGFCFSECSHSIWRSVNSIPHRKSEDRKTFATLTARGACHVV